MPLKAMGRFVREAAAVDPRTGIVYMTEDRDDSLLYRFLPNSKGELHKGGRLQTLGWFGQQAGGDSRNWQTREIAPRAWAATRWGCFWAPADPWRWRGWRGGTWPSPRRHWCWRSGSRPRWASSSASGPRAAPPVSPPSRRCATSRSAHGNGNGNGVLTQSSRAAETEAPGLRSEAGGAETKARRTTSFSAPFA